MLNPPTNYVINASDDIYEDDDSFETAENITINTIQDRSIYPIADPDYIAFELNSTYEVTIRTNNSVGDTRIWLYNYQRELVAFDDNIDDNDLNASIYIELLYPDIYFLKIEETGNDAEIDSYSISITAEYTEFYEEDNEMMHPGMFLNESITRSIQPIADVDYMLVDNNFDASFNFTIETTGSYGGDTIMECRTNSGSAAFATDDNSGEGNYSKIELTNYSGNFYVVIYAPAGEQVLNYTLHVTAYNSTFSDSSGPSVNHTFRTLTETYGEAGANLVVNNFDYLGISEATIHYRVNSGSWQTAPLYRKSQYNWNGFIGTFLPKDFVEYYITSTDNSASKNTATDDNDGKYYNFTILHNDFDGPSITNVHEMPSAPNDTETVTINSTITDLNGIKNSTLFYRENGGDWLNITMNLDVNNNYLATIGIFDYEDEIEYYIVATDNSTQYNTAINNNSDSFFSFTTAASDFTGPTITSVQYHPVTPNETSIITISCSITDINGITDATLYYRVNEGEWLNSNLALDSGSTYAATIGPFEIDDFIQYYINATDNYILQNFAVDDNSGVYYGLRIGYSDHTGPTIDSISHEPIQPSESDTVTISCSVSDPNGIVFVHLYYMVNDGDWSIKPMTNIEGSTYEADIGLFDYTDEIVYYIIAIDNYVLHNLAINDNSGAYYSFSIIASDTTNPEISNVAQNVETPIDGESVNITCSVYDENGLSSVRLYFRVNEGEWYSISMKLIVGNNYTATTLTFDAGDFVEYYIEALDNSFYHNVGINDNDGDYYSFNVLAASSKGSLYALIPAVVSFSIIILIRRRE